MNKVAIVTDTNSSMTLEETDALGVYLLPMPIIIDGREYFEGVDIRYADFFKTLADGSVVSTSQPSPESVTAIWDRALENSEKVIHIPMSSALSGSCQTAMALAEDYNGRVIVIDNRRISISQRRSVLDAVELARRGLDAGEIAEKLLASAGDSSIYLAVQTLELLKRSGRVTSAGAAIATVLGINPVLQIQGGKLDAFAKVRGMKRAAQTMLNAIDNDLKDRFADKHMIIDLAYSGDEAAAAEWCEEARAHFESAEINLYRLPLSICCHVAGGVRAVGISVSSEEL